MGMRLCVCDWSDVGGGAPGGTARCDVFVQVCRIVARTTELDVLVAHNVSQCEQGCLDVTHWCHAVQVCMAVTRQKVIDCWSPYNVDGS